MATTPDLARFFIGEGRKSPSIFTPAAAARDRMFGRGQRGKFEAADLLELLGDPGLLLGGGIGLGGLGMAAMRGAGRRAGRETGEAASKLLLRELAPRAAREIPAGQSLQPPITMGKYGPVARLTSEPSPIHGSIVPGAPPTISQSGKYTVDPMMHFKAGPEVGPGESLSEALSPGMKVMPEYEVPAGGILDAGEAGRPLESLGGRTSREVWEAANSKIRGQSAPKPRTTEPITSFRGENEFLSNFHESPIVLQAGRDQPVTYPTVEHAFQAQKTSNPTEQARILRARTPAGARELGRKVKMTPDWPKRREGVMRNLIYEKFRQNPELGRRLTQTSDRELVEGNQWGDRFWGKSKSPQTGELVGENKLGKILMEVREQLLAEEGRSTAMTGGALPSERGPIEAFSGEHAFLDDAFESPIRLEAPGSKSSGKTYGSVREALRNTSKGTTEGPAADRPMRTIIAGSRDITDPEAVEQAVSGTPWEISEVVSGAAKGVDKLGEQLAERSGIPVKRFPAKWKRHGKKAGYIRNREMLKNADALVAVWDGESPGTGHMIKIAREKGIPVHIHNPTAGRRDLLDMKFRQNPELRRRLLQTDPRKIGGKEDKALMDIRDRMLAEEGMPKPPTHEIAPAGIPNTQHEGAVEAAPATPSEPTVRAPREKIGELADALRPLTSGDVSTLQSKTTHPMKFVMPAKSNIWGRNTTTMDEIIAGNRTSTTRGWGAKLPSEGDILKFEGKGKSATVRVKKVTPITKERMADPEFQQQWSRKEGWKWDEAKKHGYLHGHQVEFELATESQAASGAGTEQARRQLATDTLRKKLNQNAAIVKKPELADILQRFVQSRPFMRQSSARQTVPTPSAATGSPLVHNLEAGGAADLTDKTVRNRWAQRVLKGKETVQPGQEQYLTREEREQLYEQATKVGKLQGEESLADLPESQRESIKAVLRDELVPEEERAAEAGANVSGFADQGGAPRGDELGVEVKTRDRVEERFAEQQEATQSLQRRQRPNLPRSGGGKITPPNFDEPPSKALTKEMPGEKHAAPNWAPQMAFRLRKAAQEMEGGATLDPETGQWIGNEWRAIAKLQDVADIPPENRSLAIGSEYPTLQKLAADKNLPDMLDRLEQIAERRGSRRTAQKAGTPRGEEFQRIMGWTAYLPNDVKKNLLRRFKRENPEVAEQLAELWNVPGTSEVAVAPETLSIKAPLEQVTSKTNRANLVEILLRHPEEFQEWARSLPAESTRSGDLEGVAKASQLAKQLQQGLREQGVRGVRKGGQFQMFSPVGE